MSITFQTVPFFANATDQFSHTHSVTYTYIHLTCPHLAETPKTVAHSTQSRVTSL